MKTIEIVAKSFGIATIRIHQLIRNNQIAYKADKISVYVDETEVERWLDRHPDKLQQWQDAYSYTRGRLISNKYMKSYRDKI